jgi:hypothetical protein
MDQDKVGAEIAKLNEDGSIEVFLHEPEHVAMVVRTALAMKNENEQLRALLDQSLKDTERLEWLIQSGIVTGRERIDSLMSERAKEDL